MKYKNKLRFEFDFFRVQLKCAVNPAAKVANVQNA